MDKDWLSEQYIRVVSSWESSISEYYPQWQDNYNIPERHVRVLKQEWNYIEAVNLLDWHKIITQDNSKVLDLGTGTGWLSGILSKNSRVKHIDALDSSQHLLDNMLPEVVGLFSGDMEKIQTIRGLFYPLLCKNEYYDVVVANAAIHHSENLLQLLGEVYRCLKKDGVFVILNEIPSAGYMYVKKMIFYFFDCLLSVLRGRYYRHSAKLTKSGILVNDILGDWMYTKSQWIDAIKKAGFYYEIIVAPFSTYKNKRGSRLTHFILKKN